MEKARGVENVYEELLKQITLYNQYKNNVDFEKAKRLSELVVNINNLAIKLGMLRGDVESKLAEMKTKLEDEERNKTILFV